MSRFLTIFSLLTRICHFKQMCHKSWPLFSDPFGFYHVAWRAAR